MPENEQPPLFPEEAKIPQEPLDTKAIAENAPKVDYEDRTSDAARDQGWGTQEVPELSHVLDNPEENAAFHRQIQRPPRSTASPPKKGFSGPVRGESEADVNPPAYHEELEKPQDS